MKKSFDILFALSFLSFLMTAAMVSVLPLWIPLLSVCALGVMCYTSGKLSEERRRRRARRRI